MLLCVHCRKCICIAKSIICTDKYFATDLFEWADKQSQLLQICVLQLIISVCPAELAKKYPWCINRASGAIQFWSPNWVSKSFLFILYIINFLYNCVLLCGCLWNSWCEQQQGADQSFIVLLRPNKRNESWRHLCEQHHFSFHNCVHNLLETFCTAQETVWRMSHYLIALLGK